jgi:hypothetical protein
VKTYGGFLTADPRSASGEAEYHGGTPLTTARACLRVVLEAVRPPRVHLPFYVCDALLQPLRAVGVPYSFYALDRLLRPVWWEASQPPRESGLIVFINYFGLLGREASACGALLRGRLVVDNVQAFFHRCASASWAFNSARKFFAVSDGAYLTGPHAPPGPIEPAVHGDAHLILSARGDLDAAFAAYQRHEAALDDTVLGMSLPSAGRLRALDYETVARRRRANYLVLHETLGALNALGLPLEGDDVPYAYPFLPPVDLRDKLIGRGVFVPAFWQEVVSRAADGFAWERQLGARLCPLPVDQRYDAQDMLDMATRVVDALNT